jgi:hypothetical protein
MVSGLEANAGGMITFLDSGTILKTVQADASGSAVLPLTSFSPGTHTLTASFSGKSAAVAAVSPVLTEEWPSSGLGFLLSMNASQGMNSQASFTVTVSGLGDFRQTVSLSCGDSLPAEFVCSFSPAQLSGGSGTSTLEILPNGTNSATNSVGHNFGYLFPAICGFLLLVSRAGSRGTSLAIAILVCGAVGWLGGCGGNSIAASTQTAVVTVRATSGSGPQPIVHSSQIQVQLRTNR